MSLPFIEPPARHDLALFVAVGCRQDGPTAVPRNGEGIGAILCTTIEVCGFDQTALTLLRELRNKSTVWQDRCWFEIMVLDLFSK